MADSPTMQVAPGMRVTLHFALSLEDGSRVDATAEDRPATFDVGDGSLPPAFERCMLGLSAGESTSRLMEPEDAFGQRNPGNLQRMQRQDFAPDMVLEPGLVVSFADAAGGELPGVVAEIEEEEVVVDFNHPLAGKRLRFEARIVSVQRAESPHG